MEQVSRGVSDTPYFQEFAKQIQSQKFQNKLQHKVEILISGGSIIFSDLVTVFAGIPQLVYEDDFFIGGYDGGVQELNEGQKHHLDGVREYINSELYKKVLYTGVAGFFCLNIVQYIDADGQKYEKLSLENAPISAGLRNHVAGIIDNLIEDK